MKSRQYLQQEHGLPGSYINFPVLHSSTLGHGMRQLVVSQRNSPMDGMLSTDEANRKVKKIKYLHIFGCALMS